MRVRWIPAAHGLACLALCGALAACQRPTQPLLPPPLFELQGPPPEPLATRENNLPAQEIRDVETPATIEDFERYAGTIRILFARGSAELTPIARAILDRQAEWLRAHPEVRASLQGHADELAPREQQFALGEKRAATMKFYLTARGVAPQRLFVTSFGREHPIATGSGEASQSQNRRGETVLLGLPGGLSRP
nr:OmpA family protein [Sphingomonas sp. CDS-1]|eukprot:Opistho-2@138